MPYVTPPSTPEELVCRSLQIPASGEWLAIVSGALTELQKIRNWEQIDGITVEAALTAVNAMIADYYDQECQNHCELPLTPGGAGIIRRTEGLYTEQLIDGEWQTPEGDYTPLPLTPREEMTDEEKRCLAATNAVNALKLTYEDVQADWEEFQDVLSAIDVAVTAIQIFVAAFAAVTFIAILELGQFLFESVLKLFSEVAEDVFDGAEQALFCIFFDNASVGVDDIVTFDFGGIRTRIFDDFVIGQIFTERSTLGLQLDYFLYYIGAEGLNYAGGLTAIESGDCSCECEIYNDDFVSGMGAFDHVLPYAGINNAWNGTVQPGTWQSTGGRTTGGCWNSANIGNFSSPSLARRNSAFVIDLGEECTVQDAEFWAKYGSNGNASSRQITYYGADLTVRRNYQPVAVTSLDWVLVGEHTVVEHVRYVRFSIECLNSQNASCFIDDMSICILCED